MMGECVDPDHRESNVKRRLRWKHEKALASAVIDSYDQIRVRNADRPDRPSPNLKVNLELDSAHAKVVGERVEASRTVEADRNGEQKTNGRTSRDPLPFA
jgi:hypothetical protein